MIKIAFILFLAFQASWAADKVKVDVYFEALCPDSKDFMVNQLFPLYMDPEFRDRLDITLVPFGKASFKEANGKLEFTCQHGPNECISNTFLSCSIKMNTFDQALKYTNCIMSEKMPAEHLESCANKLSLNYAELMACKEDQSKGPQYLKENGNKTFALKPKMVFVPTVVVNDKFERKLIPEILGDFKKFVCARMEGSKPKSC